MIRIMLFSGGRILSSFAQTSTILSPPCLSLLALFLLREQYGLSGEEAYHSSPLYHVMTLQPLLNWVLTLTWLWGILPYFLLGPCSLTAICETATKRKPLQVSFFGAFCTLHHRPYVFLESWRKRQIALGKEVEPTDWNLQWCMNHYLIFCWDQMLRMCKDLGSWKY